MTILEYYEGLERAKRALPQDESVEEVRPMTADELRRKYQRRIVRKWSKGAKGGYKYDCRIEWTDYGAFLRELRELFPREYALELCQIELNDLKTDRWWDTPEFRAMWLTEYRRRITSIRKQYGLTSAEVSEFMRGV